MCRSGGYSPFLPRSSPFFFPDACVLICDLAEWSFWTRAPLRSVPFPEKKPLKGLIHDGRLDRLNQRRDTLTCVVNNLISSRLQSLWCFLSPPSFSPEAWELAKFSKLRLYLLTPQLFFFFSFLFVFLKVTEEVLLVPNSEYVNADIFPLNSCQSTHSKVIWLSWWIFAEFVGFISSIHLGKSLAMTGSLTKGKKKNIEVDWPNLPSTPFEVDQSQFFSPSLAR